MRHSTQGAGTASCRFITLGDVYESGCFAPISGLILETCPTTLPHSSSAAAPLLPCAQSVLQVIGHFRDVGRLFGSERGTLRDVVSPCGAEPAGNPVEGDFFGVERQGTPGEGQDEDLQRLAHQRGNEARTALLSRRIIDALPSEQGAQRSGQGKV